MKKNYLFSSVITLIFITIISVTLTAQVYTPSGQPLTHNQSEYGILINTGSNIHYDTPNVSNIRTGIGIDALNTTYGSRMAIDSRVTSSGATGQTAGVARGRLAFASDWLANGALMGVSGTVDSVTVLNTTSNKESVALGGNFSIRVFDPIQSAGDYTIAGARAILDGNISTYPTSGVVAALYADDRIDGSGTWAGYFDGRGYFDGNVGIKTTNPLSDLSVNGDGNSLYTSSFYSDGASNGSRAIFAQTEKPSGFGDHVRSINGIIESGTGWAYGMVGSAMTDNPSAGRAFGVFGVASNATDGTNYGVYGTLQGSNGGTGILGYDQINFEDQQAVLLPQGTTWAGYFIGNGHFTNNLTIGTHNMPAMTTAGGNSYKLYVAGGGLFEEVNVQVGWADYVFEEDYKLTSLEDVENHIQNNGYLHNTPSAQEIEEKGLALGAITVNQQEKIEELYLHLIEMNKALKDLKSQNEALIEKVNLLERR